MQKVNGTLILVTDGESTYASLNGEILNGRRISIIGDGTDVTWSLLDGWTGIQKHTEEDLIAFAKKLGYRIERIKETEQENLTKSE